MKKKMKMSPDPKALDKSDVWEATHTNHTEQQNNCGSGDGAVSLSLLKILTCCNCMSVAETWFLFRGIEGGSRHKAGGLRQPTTAKAFAAALIVLGRE